MVVYAVLKYPQMSDLEELVSDETERLVAWRETRTEWFTQFKELGQLFVLGSLLPLLGTIAGYIFGRLQGSEEGSSCRFLPQTLLRARASSGAVVEQTRRKGDMRTIAVSLTTLLLLVPVTSAAAAIRITKVQNDSPGSDTGSDSSLNAEWVKIKNTGKKAVNLKRWSLRDSGSDHVYKFGSFKIKAGRTVTIHTGSGSNNGWHRYWGQGWYVWNNDGDTATLKKRGKVKDKCSWGRRRHGQLLIPTCKTR